MSSIFTEHPDALRTLIVLRLILLLGGLLALAGCSRHVGWTAVDRLIARDFPDTPTVSTDALAERLASDAPPVLVDVRETEEYAVSHLPGALHLPPDALETADALPPEIAALDRDTPIVAYCSVGYRSAGMTARLREAGFTHVENLDGSIFRWANEGRPVVRDGEAVRDVHPYDRAWGVLLRRELRATEPGA